MLRLTSPPVALPRGMTLIEILVVMVIIAILAATVTVAIGALGGDSEIEDETRRLTDVIGLALEQAELEGRDYGLRLEPEGYEVMGFDGRRGWVQVTDDPWFGRHALPPGLVFALEVEGRRVLLRRAERPETRLPQLIAYAGGEMTPYRITLSRVASGTTATLTGTFDGTIELSRDDER